MCAGLELELPDPLRSGASTDRALVARHRNRTPWAHRAVRDRDRGEWPQPEHQMRWSADEIQAACDRLVIISPRSLVFEGPTQEHLDRLHTELVVVPEYCDHLDELAVLLDERGIGFTTSAGLRAPGCGRRLGSSQPACVRTLRHAARVGGGGRGRRCCPTSARLCHR